MREGVAEPIEHPNVGGMGEVIERHVGAGEIAQFEELVNRGSRVVVDFADDHGADEWQNIFFPQRSGALQGEVEGGTI